MVDAKRGDVMKVRELMTSPAHTARPTTTLQAAAITMLRHDCGALVVVNEDRGPVGMITDRDICIALAMQRRPAAEVMVSSVAPDRLLTVDWDKPHQHALDLMGRARVRRLAVVDDHSRLVGVISINDAILAAAAASGEAQLPLYAEVLSAIQSLCGGWRMLRHTV